MLAASLIDGWNRATRNPLAVAFAISLLLHAAGYGTWKKFGPGLFASSQSVLASVIARLTHSERQEKKLLDELKQRKNQELFERMLKQQQEIPLTFLEVDPALALADPPKDPKYYSTHNTVAANPDPKSAAQPKIEGRDTKVARLFDNPKPQPKAIPQPLQPTFPPRQPDPPAQTASKPKETEPPQLRPDARPDAKSEPARPLETIAPQTFDKATEKPDLKPPGGETPGDLAMARPQPTEHPNKIPGAGAPASANPLITDPSPPPQHERPRTLAQAYAQKPMLAGQKMQQAGGVPRQGRISQNAIITGFGVYDAAFIAAVEERWYQLIDSYRDKGGVLRQGKAVLEFKLHFNGRITEMKTAERTVEELQSLMCERAVLDPAPFARWPDEMRQTIGADIREVKFTFFYE